MAKSLGQVAYEAYFKAAAGAEPVMWSSFEDQWDDLIQAWQAAAEAVAKEAKDRDAYWRVAARIANMVRVNEQEWEVIEAAKAARHASSTGGRHMGIIILFDKVDTLQAVEEE